MSHSLASNTATANILVEVWDQQGRRGYGEGIPRVYVTGEDVSDSLQALRRRLAPLLLGREISPFQVLGWLESVAGSETVNSFPAAACALETALLDLIGQELSLPFSALLGPAPPQPVTYSAVVPLLDPAPLAAVLAQVRALGLTQVKVKVDGENALEPVAQVRRILGPGARLRVDANGSWRAEQAVETIRALTSHGVEAVEQPVPKEDLAGLALVNAKVEPLILADESLCTMDQARELIRLRAVGGFNLRLSKCGGPARTLKMLSMARRAGLVCQLGCQVGELGILSAAGRHFACIYPELVYLEGSLTRFFLPRDVISQDLTFESGGQAPPLNGPGLGVQVDVEVLRDSLEFSLS